MNEPTVEKLLRKAPAPPPPAALLQELRAKIELPAVAATHHGPRLTGHPLRRWLPALGFALWFLGCLVVFGIQASRIAELRRANDSLKTSRAALEQAEEQRALALTRELEQLRKDVADVQRLRAEVEQLRAAAAELAALRAQNQQLRAELPPQAAPPVKPEEDFFAVRKEQQARLKCVSNLKYLGLAARIWANGSKTDRLPPDRATFEAFLPTLNKGEEGAWVYGRESFLCPADGVTAYEILSPGAPEDRPEIVFVRCPLHNNCGMVDGSVQSLGDKGRVVQKDGHWVCERP